METKEIEKIVKKELRKLGIKAKFLGYHFLATAVAECEVFSCKTVYNKIARRYRTTPSRVERAIRYIICNNMKKIQEEFETENKVTNAEMFYLLKEKVEDIVDYETRENVEKEEMNEHKL